MGEKKWRAFISDGNCPSDFFFFTSILIAQEGNEHKKYDMGRWNLILSNVKLFFTHKSVG